MFGKRKTLLLVAGILTVLTIYMFLNREHFVAEHLTNKNPTLFSIQKELDETNQKLQELNADYQSLKSQGQAQSSQAAAAMASLKAIPAASTNTVIPTR
jgi:hypothetical protein